MIDFDLKIMSCNLNGIKSAKRKGFHDVVSGENPDIICIQETRTCLDNLPDDLINIPGYVNVFYSNPNPVLCGVAIYSKVKPLSTQSGLDIEDDIEGRLLRFDYPDFTLINAYVPSGSNMLKLQHKHDFVYKLFNYVKDLHDEGKNVILCGDFNIAHDKRDLYFKEFKSAGFLPEERKMIDCFLKSGFKDAFRELYHDEEKFSWMSWRTRNNPNLGGGLRLDYFFVNNDLMDFVVDCEIKDFNLSDHCQLFLKLNLKKENVED